MQRKGILLAGGSGTRLFPITQGVSKQMLPIYDKPMIYYPLCVLMQAGIRDIAVITTPQDRGAFKRLLGDGSAFGVTLTYILQPRPDGLAQAYLLAEDFLQGAPSALVLGDNLFFGPDLPAVLADADQGTGATVFGYRVKDPERYGVLAFDQTGAISGIVEKPDQPPSDLAVTGLYFLPGDAAHRARSLRPSPRGELEITDLLRSYLLDRQLTLCPLGRGHAWLDTGTHASLLEAGSFVRTLQDRQGLQTGSPEATAFEQGWIDRDRLLQRAFLFAKTDYGRHLMALADDTPCSGPHMPAQIASPLQRRA